MSTTWEKDAASENLKSHPRLDKNIEVDVAIIGGGITGVLNAYYLSRLGNTVALIESKKLGGHATAMTTAFITEVIDTNLTEVIEIYGSKTAKIVWESGERAIDE